MTPRERAAEKAVVRAAVNFHLQMLMDDAKQEYEDVSTKDFRHYMASRKGFLAAVARLLRERTLRPTKVTHGFEGRVRSAAAVQVRERRKGRKR